MSFPDGRASSEGEDERKLNDAKRKMDDLKGRLEVGIVTFLFFKKFLEDKSPFCGATDIPVLVTSVLGFKARVGSVLSHLSTMDSLNSPLV